MAFKPGAGLTGDDGYINGNLYVSGNVTLGNVLSSSAAGFAQLTTFNNALSGQTLTTQGTFYQITQWLTQSLTSPTIIAGNQGVTASATGLHIHNATISFSGSAGTYVFSMFENDVQGNGALGTIDVGQSHPTTITITDCDFHNPSDLPARHDIRVACTTGNNKNFQLNYGAFNIYRVGG